LKENPKGICQTVLIRVHFYIYKFDLLTWIRWEKRDIFLCFWQTTSKNM